MAFLIPQALQGASSQGGEFKETMGPFPSWMSPKAHFLCIMTEALTTYGQGVYTINQPRVKIQDDESQAQGSEASRTKEPKMDWFSDFSCGVNVAFLSLMEHTAAGGGAIKTNKDCLGGLESEGTTFVTSGVEEIDDRELRLQVFPLLNHPPLTQGFQV